MHLLSNSVARLVLVYVTVLLLEASYVYVYWVSFHFAVISGDDLGFICIAFSGLHDVVLAPPSSLDPVAAEPLDPVNSITV